MRTSFKILLFADAITLFAGALLGPIYAIYVQKIGGDILEASGAFAVFSLVSAVLIFIIGRFEDRVKEQELLIVAGYAIIGFGYFGYLFVETPLQLFLLQGLLGVGIAIELPAIDSTYSKHLDHRRSAYNWGAWEAMNRLTLGAGALVGGGIVTMFGFPTLFVVMGALSLASALFILFLPREVL